MSKNGSLPLESAGSGHRRPQRLHRRVLSLAKGLLWKTLPQSIGDRILTFHIRHNKKFKKQDWVHLNVYPIGKCNLNCVNCQAFAPVADGYMLDAASFESDCRRLSDLGGGQVWELTIAGGEPLLYPHLAETLSIARSYFPHAKLRIVTNGTLLLKQKESFWDCCRSNGVNIVISHYPIKLDIKPIKAAAKKYGLKLTYYRGVLPWYKLTLDLGGNCNPRESYKKCYMGLRCVELRDGKIATCMNIMHFRYFNNYFQKNIEICDTDTIDIYKAKSMDEILNFISKPAPFCRYCTGKSTPVKWGVSKKDISEWT